MWSSKECSSQKLLKMSNEELAYSMFLGLLPENRFYTAFQARHLAKRVDAIEKLVELLRK